MSLDSMIRLDQPSFRLGHLRILPSPEQALTGSPDSAARLRRPNASGQKCESVSTPSARQDRLRARVRTLSSRPTHCECLRLRLGGEAWRRLLLNAGNAGSSGNQPLTSHALHHRNKVTAASLHPAAGLGACTGIGASYISQVAGLYGASDGQRR